MVRVDDPPMCIRSATEPLDVSLELLQLQDMFVKVVDDVRLESQETGRGRPRIHK